ANVTLSSPPLTIAMARESDIVPPHTHRFLLKNVLTERMMQPLNLDRFVKMFSPTKSPVSLCRRCSCVVDYSVLLLLGTERPELYAVYFASCDRISLKDTCLASGLFLIITTRAKAAEAAVMA